MQIARDSLSEYLSFSEVASRGVEKTREAAPRKERGLSPTQLDLHLHENNHPFKGTFPLSYPNTHTPSPVICPSLPHLCPFSLSGLPGLLSSYLPSSHHASSPHFLSLLSLPHTMLPLLSVERAACMPNQVIHKYRTNVCHYTFTAMTKAGLFCPQKVCPLATWDHSPPPPRRHTLHLSFTGVNILPINIHWSDFEGCIVCLHLCFQNPKSAFPCAPRAPPLAWMQSHFLQLGLRCTYLFWLKPAGGYLRKIR